jgi:hypothetical protein
VERVEYSASTPWPAGANGTGASLTRIDPATYGNEPLNWTAAPATPGRVEPRPPSSWRLEIELNPAGGITVRAAGRGTGEAVLQTSRDLAAWDDVAATPAAAGSLEYADPTSGETYARYFRVILRP